jgi:hypothetical protein
MHKTIFLILLSFTLPAEANAKKIDLKPKHEKVEDPGSATPLLYKSPKDTKEAEAHRQGLKISASCTDGMGMVVKQGEKGYEACLRNLDRLMPQKVDEKNPNSVGITIGN